MTERETAPDTNRGDENALQYARKMRVAHPELRSEFLYIMVWTARRLKRYLKSDNAAREGIENFPEDPRFYHGRSVNTACWLEDDKQKRLRFCRWTAKDPIQDARRAFELYSREDADHTGVRAIQLNNIAWMHASASKDSPQFDLRAAREALDLLIQLMPRASWLPMFANFFHTEAYIEYQECKNLRQSGATYRESLQIRLQYAQQSLQQAMTARNSDLYYELKDQIKRELNRILRKPTKVYR